jgi:hypothetical protein
VKSVSSSLTENSAIVSSTRASSSIGAYREWHGRTPGRHLIGFTVVFFSIGCGAAIKNLFAESGE